MGQPDGAVAPAARDLFRLAARRTGSAAVLFSADRVAAYLAGLRPGPDGTWRREDLARGRELMRAQGVVPRGGGLLMPWGVPLDVALGMVSRVVTDPAFLEELERLAGEGSAEEPGPAQASQPRPFSSPLPAAAAAPASPLDTPTRRTLRQRPVPSPLRFGLDLPAAPAPAPPPSSLVELLASRGVCGVRIDDRLVFRAYEVCAVFNGHDRKRTAAGKASYRALVAAGALDRTSHKHPVVRGVWIPEDQLAEAFRSHPGVRGRAWRGRWAHLVGEEVRRP